MKECKQEKKRSWKTVCQTRWKAADRKLMLYIHLLCATVVCKESFLFLHTQTRKTSNNVEWIMDFWLCCSLCQENFVTGCICEKHHRLLSYYFPPNHFSSLFNNFEQRNGSIQTRLYRTEQARPFFLLSSPFCEMNEEKYRNCFRTWWMLHCCQSAIGGCENCSCGGRINR